MTPDRNTILQKLQQSVQRLKGQQLDVSDLDEESELMEHLGLDSLDLLEMRFDIEESWDIKLEDSEAVSLKTVRDVVDVIQSKCTSA